MGKDVKRLYTEFQPEHYTLHLKPDYDRESFEGSVTITGKRVSRPSQRLTFHQAGLRITNATITKHDKKADTAIPVDRINHHKSADEVRLHTEHMLYPGQYTVTLQFSGKITKQMNGIYPCFFENEGKKQTLIATQFESHHAREAFPCVDEPEAKATFDLTLVTPKGQEALANTPVQKQTTKGKLTTTTFETTPKMSTYLLAFVYGNMAYKEAQTKDGVIVRTYATPDNVGFTDFALDVAVKCLEFYNDYFATKYPLPKCDMIALPDFASGAMENWGCITYREQCMLVDPENTALGTKQYVAMVVAHELAHQWFGNLVTMRWWTDLWLNEGFASWIEYLAIDHIFPEWQMWTQFVVDEQQRAFKLDALEHTHPIEVPVRHPDEIRTIFDTISYSKGASVIHMLHEYLGAEMFRDGLRHYLNLHAYGNTDTIDLWSALEAISGKPVKDFMHTWTSQSGFPVVHANVQDTTVILTQERFFLNPEYKPSTDELWPIATLSGTREIADLQTTKRETYTVSDPHMFKLNRGQSGFYRTIYNADHMQQLHALISNGQLSPIDRLGILSDLLEAAKAGKTSTVAVLQFLEAFSKEDNNAVWDTIARGIVSIRSVMDDEDLRQLMKPFIATLTERQLDRLGWEPKPDESHFDTLLRPTIIGLAAGAEVPEVVKECLRQFDAMKKPEDINPDLRSVVYTTAVRHGDVKTFNKLFKIHEESSLSEERTTIAAALTSFKQADLIDKALNTINSDSVRLQDVSYWIAYSFSNRFARDATWAWVQEHWQWLRDNLGSDLSFYRFPMYAANAYSTRTFLAAFKEFFLPKMEPAFERSINQGIEILTWQSAWKERDFDEVCAFFKTKPAP